MKCNYDYTNCNQKKGFVLYTSLLKIMVAIITIIIIFVLLYLKNYLIILGLLTVAILIFCINRQINYLTFLKPKKPKNSYIYI